MIESRRENAVQIAGDDNTVLPEGWSSAPLENLVVFTLGGDWGKTPHVIEPGTRPARVIRGTDFRNWTNNKPATTPIRVLKESSLEKRRLVAGDLIVEVSGGGPDQPVGRVLVINADSLSHSDLPFVCSNFCRQVRLHSEVDPRFIAFWIQYQYMQGVLDEFQTQTTNIRNLNFADFLSRLIVPVAPKPEQSRIVLAIDRLTQQVQTSGQRLTGASQLIQRFRQSVLAAAFSGRLTADWRERVNDLESPSLLLERIIEERRRASKGRGRYRERESEPPDAARLPDLPDVWTWVTVGQLSSTVQYGYTARAEDQPTGRPRFLRITDIQNGEVDWASVPGCAISADDVEKYRLLPGDVVFARTGATTGKSYLVPADAPQAVFASYLIRVRLVPLVIPAYVYLFFQGPLYWQQIEAGKRGIGQPNVNAQILSRVAVPLPPLREQELIVERVSALLKVENEVGQRVEAASQGINELTQLILGKAFRGELVPTEAELARHENRDYKPASLLLERIRAERAAPKASSRLPGAGKRER
jgi:type I restriction enzyme S subunit